MEQNSLEKKWGKEGLSLGWVAVPSSLLILQKTLGIEPVAMNVLFNLIASWWETSKYPYLSQNVIAGRIGTSKRTVQRAIRELENLRLIEVKRTTVTHPVFKGRNVYDLSPLVETLIKLSPELKKRMSSMKEDEFDDLF